MLSTWCSPPSHLFIQHSSGARTSAMHFQGSLSSFPLISLKWRIWHNWSASTALTALYFIAIWQHTVFLYCFQYLLFFHPPFKFRAPEKFTDYPLQTHMQSKCHDTWDFLQSSHLPPFLLLFHIVWTQRLGHTEDFPVYKKYTFANNIWEKHYKGFKARTLVVHLIYVLFSFL